MRYSHDTALAPDLQESARRLEERIADRRAESGTWLERKTDVSKLKVAPQFAAVVAGRKQGMQS